MRVNAWTVNSVSEARRLQAIGVDGITTDRPLLVRQQLAEQRLRNDEPIPKRPFPIRWLTAE
jgi:hypothetical protein